MNISFNKYNNIVGWAVFLIAGTVYTLTVEPTASFWDCGEFIATSYKLMVPHPPGAPLFLLTGRLFSMLALGNTEMIAFWVNMSSVVFSALTILFLYWTTVLLARKFLPKEKELTSAQRLTVFGSGIIAALAYTFSDSFWFSATETEVYAMSSFFTAFVFWAILKWERIKDESRAGRWIILIAYVIGLSIGTHLLSLLAIPVLAFVIYFKKFKTTVKGSILTFIISGAVLLFVLSGIITGFPVVAGKLEVFFVNDIGLPFGSGIIFFGIILISALIFGIIHSVKKQKPLLNTVILSLVFIIIGYTSYAIIPIRSGFDPPIDENNPEEIMSYVSYLKREQYAQRPLMYGPYYNTKVKSYKDGSPRYRKGDGKYVIYDYETDIEYDSKGQTLFPRMASMQDNHAEDYKRIMGIRGNGKPDFWRHNIGFFVKYQLGHMYWRYFMWNFAGRESDIQNAGWLTPWESDKDLPEVIKNNTSRNNFYMLPFILGLIGLVFMYKRKKKDTFVTVLLFIMTGIAVIFYTNQPPVEPRERDYALVGSFYVFALWIGFGFFAVTEFLKRFFKDGIAGPALAGVLCLSVPVIMAAEGWDDHDRSNRYLSVDQAKNLLNSCAENAVLFTAGDNDTFPLWYVQNVEGFRTDVRVLVMTYLGSDWYINQAKQQFYDSKPLPISMAPETYIQGKNDALYVTDQLEAINLDEYMSLIRKNSPLIQMPDYKNISVLPSGTLFLPVNKDALIQKGIVPANKRNEIVDTMVWKVKKRQLNKNDLALLDMISTGNWERPIYFNTSSLFFSTGLDLQNYVQREGLAYRLLPITWRPNNSFGERVDTDIMYDNLMNNYFHRETANPDVNFNTYYQTFAQSSRTAFLSLSQALYQQNRFERAKEVISRCFEIYPDKTFPYTYPTQLFVPTMFKIGMKKEALELIKIMGVRAEEELDYYAKTGGSMNREVESNIQALNLFVEILKSEGYPKESKTYQAVLDKYTSSPNP